ncbi:MAG: ornithine carbamoyltransferase [Trueperella sp.]|nr:ornithine carbamoyltransferase [Trueperella sp.]
MVEKLALRGKSFLKEADFTPEQWLGLVELAADLKAQRKLGTEEPRLTGKNIALIFEKTSTRTRSAFEVAAYDQGAHVTVLDAGSQIGHKESIADTAQVLGRFFDGIEFRGSGQDDVETLAQLAGVPVFNGLTDQWHPTQMLADALTIREHIAKPFTEVRHAYLGDARFNTGRSLLVSSAMLGMDVRIVAPTQFQPDAEAREIAATIAQETGARITITDDLTTGLADADVVSTDVWVSMGEAADVWQERIDQLLPYQVNEAAMALAAPDAIFLHCLPAFHDLGTAVGREIYAQTGLTELEVTDAVFSAPASKVFDQAENRLHTIKAVLVATLAD